MNKDLTYEQLRELLGNLPEFEFVEQCRQAVDKTIREAGEIMVRGISLSSAERLTGPEAQGKKKEPGRPSRHGSRSGTIFLGPVKVRARRPRVRSGRGQGGEVKIPSWETLRSDEQACRGVHKALISGLTTRRFKEAMGCAQDAVGVSKSTVSRRFVRQAAKELDLLTSRPVPRDLLAVFVDGMATDGSLITAVGVDSKGAKHALG